MESNTESKKESIKSENDIESSHVTELLDENQRLLEENNELLVKLHRHARWGFWIRIGWFAVLLGLPFLLYFYVLEPYFALFGANLDSFMDGVKEIPGYRSVVDSLCSPPVGDVELTE